MRRKYDVYNFISNSPIANRLVVAKRVEFGGEVEWEVGVRRCELLYTEWRRTRSYCIAQGTIFNVQCETIMENSIKKYIYV